MCVAFVDMAGSPTLPAGLDTLANLVKQAGINRIDYQWGFDAEALMTVTRVVAPRPWKTGLALFDQPTFEKTSLVPMPESVSSFVELSINPSKLLDELEQIGPPGAVKAQIDELSEKIKSAGQIDLRKDILAHLGPRMVAYLAPGRSAAANDDSLEVGPEKRLHSDGGGHGDANVSSQADAGCRDRRSRRFWQGTRHDDDRDQQRAGSQAIEKEAEERKAAEKAKAEAARRPRRSGRRSGEADASEPRKAAFWRRGSIRYPARASRLCSMTPSDSKLRFGPSSFRPTILVAGKVRGVRGFDRCAAGGRAAAPARTGSPRPRSSEPVGMCRRSWSCSASPTGARAYRRCWPACPARFRR